MKHLSLHCGLSSDFCNFHSGDKRVPKRGFSFQTFTFVHFLSERQSIRISHLWLGFVSSLGMKVVAKYIKNFTLFSLPWGQMAPVFSIFLWVIRSIFWSVHVSKFHAHLDYLVPRAEYTLAEGYSWVARAPCYAKYCLCLSCSFHLSEKQMFPLIYGWNQ